MEQYSVYKIEPSYYCYRGFSLVAAKSVKEANEYIKNFQEIDKDNSCDSWGYSFVNEFDKIDYLFSTQEGIIEYGIYYTG